MLVENELESGERLVWVGQPKPYYFSKMVMPKFLMGIPFTSFAFFWTGMAIWMGFQAPAPIAFRLFFPAFGIPFILVGLFMLSSPLRNYRQLKTTLYAITDSRVIIFSGSRTINIQSHQLHQMSSTQRSVNRGGLGNLFFSTQQGEMGFLEQIEDPQYVEQLLNREVKQDRPPLKF